MIRKIKYQSCFLIVLMILLSNGIYSSNSIEDSIRVEREFVVLDLKKVFSGTNGKSLLCLKSREKISGITKKSRKSLN